MQICIQVHPYIATAFCYIAVYLIITHTSAFQINLARDHRFTGQNIGLYKTITVAMHKQC